MLNRIARLPLRKPLAVLAVGVFLFMFLRAHLTGLDIPPNAAGVCNAFIGVVLAGYFASSAYESANKPTTERAEKNDDDG
jgi:hypothetical protein